MSAFIILITTALGVIYFLDMMFRSCMFIPYLKILNVYGLSIKPGIIHFEVSCFNQLFQELGNFKPHILRKWFDIGAIFVILSVLPCVILVASTLYQMVSGGNGTSQLLLPVIPGYNVSIIYYIVAIFISLVFHEFGHALAACREKLPLKGFGISVFFIFPLAYVKLSDEQLMHLDLWQRMRIVSAGIWHNFILAICACSILFINPYIMSPLYEHSKGVTVLKVDKFFQNSSPLGFNMGDQIVSINNCKVDTVESWYKCLENINLNNSEGYCIAKGFIHLQGKDLKSCCESGHHISDHFCFEPSNTLVNNTACLPVRKAIEHSNTCISNAECRKEECMIPKLASKSEKFLKISRLNNFCVFYVGTVKDLISAIEVNSWIQKFNAFPILLMEIYEEILIHVACFSAGLAVINIIPCFVLDGKYICEILVHLYLSHLFSLRSQQALLIKILKIIGFCLLFINFLCGFCIILK